MIESFKLPVITKETVSGSVASFNSEYAELPLDELIVNIPVTQEGSGTPSPQNIRSINGYSNIHISQTAICVIDQQFELGGLRNTDGAKYNTNDRLRSVNRYFVKPNMEFYLSMPTSGMWVYEYDINGTYINRYQLSAGNTYTVHTGAYQIALEIYGNYGTTYNNNISLNYPSTDTSYHAYTGNTYTISFGQTVYAGTLDVLTGVLTVTHGIVDLGSLNWLLDITEPSIHFTSQSVPSGIKLPSTYSETANIICSNYDTKSWESAFHSAGHKNEIAVSTGGVIGISDRDTSSPDSFKTAMNGVPLVYELATPTTIQLTPAQVETIVGQNNIFADTGDTSVKFLKVR